MLEKKISIYPPPSITTTTAQPKWIRIMFLTNGILCTQSEDSGNCKWPPTPPPGEDLPTQRYLILMFEKIYIYWNCNKVAVLIILISDYNFAHTFWLINKMFIAVYIIVFCIAMKVFGLIWPYLKRSVKWIIYLFSWRIHLHLKIIRKPSESIRREHWYSFLGHSKLSIFDLFSIFLCIHVLSYVLHHFSSPLSIFHPILSFFIQIQKNK